MRSAIFLIACSLSWWAFGEGWPLLTIQRAADAGDSVEDLQPIFVSVSVIESQGSGLVQGGGEFEVGTAVTVLAEADSSPVGGAYTSSNPHWVFKGWRIGSAEGELISLGPTYSFEAESDVSLVAVYALAEVPAPGIWYSWNGVDQKPLSGMKKMDMTPGHWSPPIYVDWVPPAGFDRTASEFTTRLSVQNNFIPTFAGQDWTLATSLSAAVSNPHESYDYVRWNLNTGDSPNGGRVYSDVGDNVPGWNSLGYQEKAPFTQTSGLYTMDGSARVASGSGFSSSVASGKLPETRVEWVSGQWWPEHGNVVFSIRFD